MNYKIQFDNLEWIEPKKGMRYKLFAKNGEQVRLIEIEGEFEHPDWCLKGHIGFMIEGEMDIEFENSTESYKVGDVLFIPDGEEHKHKPKAKTSRVKFVSVEKVET